MLLIVGWDGASFDVVGPMLKAGELPNLAELLERSACRRLRSTTPAVTFPAWTSFMTAASPGYHGILDFSFRPDHSYSVRFVNGSYRRLPTIWRRMSDAGLRVGVYALPATYPAETLHGVQVCGFDTPFGTGKGSKFSYPNGLIAEIEKRYGGIAVDGPSQSRLGAGWYHHALEQMLETIDLRAKIVCDLLTNGNFDCFCVHFGESDTVAHHFWQFDDAGSPRSRLDGPAGGIKDVYRGMDRALGRLLEAVPDGGSVMLVSDHGSGGASDRVIFWNRWLADEGFLRFTGTSSFWDAAFGAARKAALRAVPESVQARLFGRLRRTAGTLEAASRFRGIDWRHTRVFSEELNYYPALWINRLGREPCGTVEEAAVQPLVAELGDRLRAWKDPIDGGPVVERVMVRGELFEGPYANLAPDLGLQLRDPDGYSYCAMPSRGGAERNPIRRMRDEEMVGRRGTTMSGSHRPYGMCTLAAPGVRPGRCEDTTLPDAGATVLALMGIEHSQEADGVQWGESRPKGSSSSSIISNADPMIYAREEEAEVVRRLRALGYLDGEG